MNGSSCKTHFAIRRQRPRRRGPQFVSKEILEVRRWIFGLCCLLGIGCGGPPADLAATYPVTGTVVDASGQPLSGGFVEFESKEDQNMLAVGDINSDGSFVLTTYVNGVPAVGAVVGDHQVTFHPPQIEHGGAAPMRFRRPQKVEAKENNLSLTLPRR